MATDALQNQLILNQLFAQSVAPISTGLEQQRQLALRQAQYRQALAQRQAEMDREYAFREQQTALTLAAQRQMAIDQQTAIGARMAAEREASQKLADMQRLRASQLYTPAELAEADKDPAKRAEMMNKVEPAVTERDIGVLKSLDDQLRVAGAEVMAEIAQSSGVLTPADAAKATDQWLAAQPQKVQEKVFQYMRANGLKAVTPEALAKIMDENRGMFGYGIFGVSDEEALNAMMSLQAYLNSARKEGQPPIGAMLAMDKVNAIKERKAQIAKQNSVASDTYNRASYEDMMKRVSDMQKEQATARNVDTELSNWFGDVERMSKPSSPEGTTVGAQPASTGGYGGLIGAGMRTVPTVVDTVTNLPQSYLSAQESLFSPVAEQLGGPKLKGQLQDYINWQRSLLPTPSTPVNTPPPYTGPTNDQITNMFSGGRLGY